MIPDTSHGRVQTAPITILILLKNVCRKITGIFALVNLINKIKQRINLDSIPHTNIRHYLKKNQFVNYPRCLLNWLIKMVLIGVRKYPVPQQIHSDFTVLVIANIILGGSGKKRNDL